MMQFKILLFFGLLIYIFSDSFVSTFSSDNDTYSKEIQKEILINQKEIDVFEEKSLEEIPISAISKNNLLPFFEPITAL